MNLFAKKGCFFFARIILIGFIFRVFFPCVGLAGFAENQYYFAEELTGEFIKQVDQQEYREKWMLCINEFNKVYKLEPYGPWAAAGLYKSAFLYLELYKRSLLDSDLAESVDMFERVIKRFPKSHYSQKAELFLEEIFNRESSYNDSIIYRKHVSIRGLRAWSNPMYTRIVIDIDKDAKFTHSLVQKDSSVTKGRRLYVDLEESRLDKNIKASIQINDELLKSAIAKQHAPNIVRIVVDIKSFNSYKIFPLSNPSRIVLDILGEEEVLDQVQKVVKDSAYSNELAKGAITRQLSLGVSKVVIDPGHGGKDYGASGALEGVYEKDITLQLAGHLAQKVEDKLGCEVILTRKTDTYLSLEERTAIANTENADLFISLHTNAAKNRDAHGVETFYLNLATDNEAIQIAARENATSTKNISDLEAILNNLMHNAKIGESSRLAAYIQSNLCSHMTNNYNYVVDKGVKQAPFYVLLGVRMPSVLIETSFISNFRECERLKSLRYQEILCDGIVKGIEEYVKCLQF